MKRHLLTMYLLFTSSFNLLAQQIHEIDYDQPGN